MSGLILFPLCVLSRDREEAEKGKVEAEQVMNA